MPNNCGDTKISIIANKHHRVCAFAVHCGSASAVSVRLRQFEKGRKMGKKHTVKLVIDHDNPPPLTAVQIANLEELKNMPDEEIDMSDIPEVDFSLCRPARPLKARQ